MGRRKDEWHCKRLTFFPEARSDWRLLAMSDEVDMKMVNKEYRLVLVDG